ncbi:MAG: GntR family transcriptional regulator [Coriobacteriales bacterium]
MELIISNSNPSPIYEQIASQIKAAIMDGSLAPGEQLPSIRGLANSLRVSVITTKRAYTDLEAQGFIETVQGRGSFVASGSEEMLREERLREVESQLMAALDSARLAGVSLPELHEMLDLLAQGDEPAF